MVGQRALHAAIEHRMADRYLRRTLERRGARQTVVSVGRAAHQRLFATFVLALRTVALLATAVGIVRRSASDSAGARFPSAARATRPARAADATNDSTGAAAATRSERATDAARAADTARTAAALSFLQQMQLPAGAAGQAVSHEKRRNDGSQGPDGPGPHL
jgi:hypothetical protein